MKKEYIYGAVAAVVAAFVTAIFLAKSPKKQVKKEIEKMGGLAKYNYAAGCAKKKGLIEEDAKVSSIDEINGLNKKQVKLVATVIGLVKANQVTTGPDRDEKGHFIKPENTDQQ
jgi:hypothetical protein